MYPVQRARREMGQLLRTRGHGPRRGAPPADLASDPKTVLPANSLFCGCHAPPDHVGTHCPHSPRAWSALEHFNKRGLKAEVNTKLTRLSDAQGLFSQLSTEMISLKYLIKPVGASGVCKCVIPAAVFYWTDVEGRVHLESRFRGGMDIHGCLILPGGYQPR